LNNTHHTGITLRRTDNTVAIGLSTRKGKDQNFKLEKNISNNRQFSVINDVQTGKQREGWLMHELKIKPLNALKVETNSLINELYNTM